MSQISASDVKKLRELSGAGMMDCKKALAEVDGDMDKAIDFLRKKGLSAAAKKSGRVAAEGVVLAMAEGDKGVILEVNAETDFSSKNDTFQAFVKRLAEVIMAENPADIDALKALPYDGGESVEETLTQLIATIGENMSIRRFQRIQVDGGVTAAYVHGDGKIGVLLGVKGSADDELANTARGIAMHVAASNPQYIHREDVSTDAVERERKVLSERAAASGKPANIIEKIVDGQLNKFYSEICLLEQAYVMDTDNTVGKALKAIQPDADVVAMHRFQLGEGIEKAESDFAAEVAAQVNG
ncbi:MAG TPA: translation elongation factor Ts [Mariprofundaceae bacterium]|nr:translation elongation factor Ts [Mariprofundaceae bacterium]